MTGDLSQTTEAFNRYSTNLSAPSEPEQPSHSTINEMSLHIPNDYCKNTARIQSSESWKITNTKMCQVLPNTFEDPCKMPSSEMSHF